MEAGFVGRGKNLYRKINDVFQLINFQPSNYSDEVYLNIAIWPEDLGEPTSLLEHKFPIKGRIEDFVHLEGQSSDTIERMLLCALDGPLSCLEEIKTAVNRGKLKNIYISETARNLLTRK